ncbi:F-box/kelch-repeat protein At3g06240-like [Corylus avellana]|uniref:F-box/kelch-repeat protein At3g06240-like n=1 Tax=Corylus avellana TaxID=13451 RepID=UPI001E1FB734|nr:F-box/kelch-repeat protein At3g06240-like [Corylus avellana]XP_059436806.1 F-box/kelch-repeat protein At3g06240-like [Corylus avellana]XP_059436807.1 F-box/kelch-repeat protein At3g06240-like [Corylus avellana]
MAKDLPADLVAQILVWLPVVSLLRCKCVSKSWYALITHQSFIRKHLLHNNNSSNTLLLLNTFNFTTLDFVLSTISYETLQLSLTQPAHPWSFWNIKKGMISVAGSCNGLVCLHASSSEFEVVIWNPATRETKVVPKSNLPRLLPAGYKTIIDSFQFGFDAKTNDYKIINLIRPFDVDVAARSFRSGGIIQSEVYSLSADSWRTCDSPLCCTGELKIDGLNTYINGMASWSASVGWEGVLSFDMSDEVFLKTPVPDDVLNNCNRHFFLLKESIAMAVGIVVDYLMWFDIWLLLEVGVKDSWTRLFSIGPFPDYIERPLGFWKSGIMFFENLDGQMVLYDPSTKEMTNLPIQGETDVSQLVTYMETLVSVNGRK